MKSLKDAVASYHPPLVWSYIVALVAGFLYKGYWLGSNVASFAGFPVVRAS